MVQLDFNDVLIVPQVCDEDITSRKQVVLECDYEFNNNGVTWSGVPVIAANMDSVGTFEVAKILSKHKMLTCLNKKYQISDYIRHFDTIDYSYVIPSTGTSASEIDNCIQIASAYRDIKFICLDVANGYLKSVAESIKYIKKVLPFTAIIAGNVVTKEGCEVLTEAGADIIKVGIGSGSVCTTRTMTGVGYPQFSAILNCNDYNIVSDGGCQTPGDIMKAFVAGSKFVMIGGMLAGHTETGCQFYGMSSKEAMVDKGLYDTYKASEGKCVTLNSRGPLENSILEILGGMRSSCTYLGKTFLADILSDKYMQDNFIQVNRQKNEIFDGK